MYREPKTIGSRNSTLRALYGTSLGTLQPEMQLRLAKAIMIITAADGELSRPEWPTLVGGVRAAQMREAMLEELSPDLRVTRG